MMLKDLRIKSGKTQREIAEKLGMTQQNYSLIENCVTKPTLQTAKKIADIYGQEIEDIFFTNENN